MYRDEGSNDNILVYTFYFLKGIGISILFNSILDFPILSDSNYMAMNYHTLTIITEGKLFS